jgi:hypothetical protein
MIQNKFDQHRSFDTLCLMMLTILLGMAYTTTHAEPTEIDQEIDQILSCRPSYTLWDKTLHLPCVDVLSDVSKRKVYSATLQLIEPDEYQDEYQFAWATDQDNKPIFKETPSAEVGAIYQPHSEFLHIPVVDVQLTPGEWQFYQVTMEQDYLTGLFSLIEASKTNHPPIAHSVSFSAEKEKQYQSVSLNGTDRDEEFLTYELLSPSSGDDYAIAYLDSSSDGNPLLYVMLEKDFFDDVTNRLELSYRVSDGKEWSKPAPITIKPSSGDETLRLGAERESGLSPFMRFRMFMKMRPGFSSEKDLPKAVDFSDQFPVAGHQGKQNSCVGWAVAYALKSYQENVEDENWSFRDKDNILGPSPDNPALSPPYSNHVFSPAFIYNQRENKKTDSGMKILANKNPVVVGISIYSSFKDIKGKRPSYQLPIPPYLGEHAVTLVGYDDEYGKDIGYPVAGAFKAINSQGTEWGDKGYFWLPYWFTEHKVEKIGPLLGSAFVLLDKKNAGVESPNDENNGEDQVVNLPNLQIQDWKVNYDQAETDSKGVLQYTLINTGKASMPADAGWVDLLLSKKPITSVEDSYSEENYMVISEAIIDLLSDQELPPEESLTREKLEFQFPSIPPGDYYFNLRIESWIDESSTKDNFSPGDRHHTISGVSSYLDIITWKADWNYVTSEGQLSYFVANTGVETAKVDIGWDIRLSLLEEKEESREMVLWHHHVTEALAPLNEEDSALLNSDNREKLLEQLNPSFPFYVAEDNPVLFNIYKDINGKEIPKSDYRIMFQLDSDELIKEINQDNLSYGSWVTIDHEQKYYVVDPFDTDNGETRRRATTGTAYNGRWLPKKKVMGPRVRIGETRDGQRFLEMLDKQPKKRHRRFTQTRRSKDMVIYPVKRMHKAMQK